MLTTDLRARAVRTRLPVHPVVTVVERVGRGKLLPRPELEVKVSTHHYSSTTTTWCIVVRCVHSADGLGGRPTGGQQGAKRVKLDDDESSDLTELSSEDVDTGKSSRAPKEIVGQLENIKLLPLEIMGEVRHSLSSRHSKLTILVDLVLLDPQGSSASAPCFSTV